MENNPDEKPKSENINNNIEDNKTKKLKYPFSGTAPNLIDKFLVLGYEQKTIDITFDRFENLHPKTKYQTRFRYYSFQERPSIINEICYDFTKDSLDNDLILELIFPNLPEMYFLDKQYVNLKEQKKEDNDEDLVIGNYSIIFSINPQDNNNSKKSYNGLGFVFFVPQEHKSNDKYDGILYVPITYVILSEFPYFFRFNEICRNIIIQIKKESDDIPIDIMIYNVVKFLQSPINKSINLTFAAPLGVPLIDDQSFDKVMNSFIALNKKDNNKLPFMFFSQLSGYPFMDLNLSFLFNLIPPDIVVEVFIFSFLEHDIIFYSSRPEILNMVMYIFTNLNYPFNDSIYYWHILSVSIKSFMSGSSTFVGKTCSTITGILDEYDPEVITTQKIREHFVLDIDEKNFFFLYQEETEEVKETMHLYNYIRSCTSDHDDIANDGTIKLDRESKIRNYFNDGIQLYEAIRSLMEELQRRAKKVTSTDYNKKDIKPSFLTIYEDESEFECLKANMRLQKAFFSFITQIIQNFLSIITIGEDEKSCNHESSEKSLPSFVINIKREELELNEEERKKRKFASKAGRIFKAKFKDSSKYSSFVVNFCKYHDAIDLYKIPYTFINEFVYYSHIAVKQNLSEVDVFKLIDQFYGKRKVNSLEEMIQASEKKNEKKIEKKNEKKTDKKKKEKSKKNKSNDLSEELEIENLYTFNFNNFIEYYKRFLRPSINREQEDDKEIFTKLSIVKSFKTYKRNGYYLSNKLLNTYANFCNDNFDKLRKIFRLIKCKKIKENEEDVQNSRLKTITDMIIDDKLFDINISNSAPFPKKNSGKLHSYASLETTTNKNKLIINDKEYEDVLFNKKMNKLERDLKIFGSYEFMDITNVIQDHFILERSFSSYALIKFSLLNIIAITREDYDLIIKNREVIKTICNFCEITKSLVRQYMNIYLNIFKALKERDTDPDNDQYDYCLSTIASHFSKTNMIPTEETTKTMKEIRESSKSNDSYLKDIDDGKDTDNNKEINQFIEQYGQFFEIHKDSSFFSSKKNTYKKFDEVMKTIESIFTGSYTAGKTSMNAISFDYKELDQLYIEAGLNAIDKDKKKFYPKTPLSLYYSTNRLLNDYLSNDFSNDDSIENDLLIYILSLLYYFKIPLIREKWIEHYKINNNNESNLLKLISKDKIKKSKDANDNVKVETERKDVNELNEIIKKIIAILVDLFKAIQNQKK
jgi:hypothetical protein